MHPSLAHLLLTASNASKPRHALLPQEVEEVGSPQGTAGSPSAAQQWLSPGHRTLLLYNVDGGRHCSVDCDCRAVTGAPGRSAAVSPRACAEVRWAHQVWTACELRKAYLGPGHQGEAVHMRSMGTYICACRSCWYQTADMPCCTRLLTLSGITASLRLCTKLAQDSTRGSQPHVKLQLCGSMPCWIGCTMTARVQQLCDHCLLGVPCWVGRQGSWPQHRGCLAAWRHSGPHRRRLQACPLCGALCH